MLRNVAVVVLDGFTPFEVGVVCEVFGVDRTDDGLPAYDFAVVASQPGPVRSSVGFTIETAFGLDRLAEADLVVISAVSDEWLAGACSACAPWRSRSAPLACLTGADAPRTGGTRRSFPAGTQPRSSIPQCSTSTR